MQSQDEIIAVIRKLTKLQQDALSRICCGDDSRLNPKTARSLATLGLIDYDLQPVPGDPMGLLLYRSEVSCIAVHMAWCQWCSETVSEDEL